MLCIVVRSALLAVVAVGLAGCASASPPAPAAAPAATKEPPGTPTTLTPQQVKIIQDGVRASLKDPDSAKFSGAILAAKRLNGDIDACGTVNAKNSYGGYVGAGPFFAKFRDGKVVDSATASGTDAKFLIQICRESGVPL